MSDTTVRLKIKIEGSDSLKEVEMSADELAKAFVSVKDKVHELNEKLLNINQISQAFEQVGVMVQSLQSVMHDLTDTYAVQAQAEARLEQMMRNTMDATDGEIQSIKDLAAEQQKLGVIGDEVILSGAQELATYMQKKESLEALIPVMDDMIAQQYGYNASAESAVSVAQMMGKVFAGEVGALKRLGYTFDEAQEAILKYGTEEEKVATLTEVVGQIVDGTNAKLAATPYGQIAKFRNDIGDIKEQLGKMVAPAMNAVDSISKLTIAIAGIGKGVSAIKGVIVAIKAMTTTAKAAETAQQGLNAAMKANVIIAVASAVAALVAVLIKLIRRSGEAAEGMEELKEANEAYKNAVGDTKAEIDTEIAALKRLMDQGEDTSDAVKHLNEAYGEAFGYYQTAVDWYDTLTKKSLTYCKQLGYEAKAKKLSAKIGELIVERDAAQKEADNNPKKTKTVKNTDPVTHVTTYSTFETRKYAKQKKKVKDLNDKIEQLTGELKSSWEEAEAAANELKPTTPTVPPILSQKEFDLVKQHYDDLTKKQRAMIDKGYADLTEDEQRALKKRYDTLSKSEKPEVDKQYNAAIKAAEEAQRKKENDLKKLYQQDGDKDAYESGMEQAAIEGLEEQLKIAQKYGKDTTKIEQQILDAKLQQRENNNDRDLNALTRSLEEKKLTLTQQLAEQEITKQQYDTQLQAAEQESYQKQLELQQQHGDNTIALQQQIAEAKIQRRNADFDREADALQQNLDTTEVSLMTSLANQQITQDQYDRAMLVAKAKFYDDMLKLTRAYGKNDTQALKDVLDAQLNHQSFDKDQKKKPFDTFTKGWGGIKGIGNSIRDIKSALTETDNAWDALTQTVDGFISLFQSMQQVVDIIETINESTVALGIAKKAETATTVAGNAEEAASETAGAQAHAAAVAEEVAANTVASTSNTAKAATGAASAVAHIPYVGPQLALSWAATIEAALSAIPKFADGGLVYGPTLGLMGEYRGASSNPEVIAPLSRLRALLGTDGGTRRDEVKFRIQGRELVGIMNKQNNIYRRSS